LTVRIVDNEGAIEDAVKEIYKAMINKNKTEVQFQYLCSSDFMHVQFLEYLSKYLGLKKAKKVNHVKIDIYIEEKD
jgi:hypothetical protein